MHWIYFWIFLSCLLPIFSGYVVSFLLLLYIVYKKYILDLAELGKAIPARLNSTNNKTVITANFYSIQTPIYIGLLVLLVSFFISSLGSFILNGEGGSLGEWLNPLVHLLAKTFILFTVLVIAFGRIFLFFDVETNRSNRNNLIIGFLLITGIYLAYCLLQREFGFDWSRGIEAYLPNNRLTGSTYRVSGFMSHPLTLAYNLCLIITAHLLFLKLKFKTILNTHKLLHAILLLFLISVLLLSQSRFPLFLTFFVIVAILAFKKSHMKFILPLIILLGSALYIEGSILERFHHLLNARDFDRLKFWQVHLEIFKESPIFGNSPKISVGTLEPFYSKFSYHDKIYSAHNIFIQILANYGIVGIFGFLFFLAKLWQFFKEIAKTTKEPSMVVLYFVFVGSNLLQNAMYDSEFLFAFWVVVCSLGAIAARIDIKNERLCKN